MKKLLAMVLALVMTLSLAVSANAAFKDDKSISDDYAESVAVLNGMGVFKGYEDGSFKPEGNITRAEVATIIYRIYTADVAKNDKSGLYATYNKFSDMAGAGWAQGYIGYCANASLVKGYPDGTFKPSGKVTGYEVLAMILRAVGYDKNNEFSGADWALHVAQTAQQLGVLDNVAKTTDLNAPASRELVAELLFQGIQKAQVTYTPAFGYVTDKVISTKTNSLGEKNFKLASAAASDKWGRPATKWTYTTGDKGTTFVEKPDLTYTKAVTECDVAHDAGLKVDTAYTLYVNGQKQPTTYTVNLTDTVTKMGAQGRLVEVYDDTIVMIDTFLAKVTYVAPAAYDAQGHLRTEATIKLDVYATKGSTAATTLTLTNGEDAYPYAVGDYVLLNAYTNAFNSATESGLIKTAADKYGEIVSKATSIDGAQSVIYYNAKQHNVEGTVYDDAAKFYFDNAVASTNKFTWFFDQYNNLIGNVEIAAATSYGVINSIWWAGNAADGSGVAKANVTYMDGTTAVVDLSKMTYFDDTASGVVAPKIATGKVTHSTGIQNKVMKVDGDYFYVDSYINTNAVCDVNGILNGHLFQFTAQTDGTVAAVEVSGNGTGATATVNGSTVTTTAKKALRSLDVAVGTDALYNGKLLTNSATIFLVRSGNGDTVPFTYKSVTGINAIGNYVQGEVDYVDLNDDGVADYVYIIAASNTAKAEGLFYYAGNNNYSYNTTTGYWTINGFTDGVDATLTVANDNFFDGISGYDTTHAGWVSKIVATSNRLYLVKTEDGLLSAEPVAYNTNDTQVTLDDDYSDAYTGKTPYVNVVAGETDSKFDNNLLSMAAGQNFTTNESTKFVVDGKTAALPYSLTDYNVIIVWDRAKSTALQVYAYSKDTTKTNTDIVYSVVARDNQVITATVNNGTLTIDQAKLVSSTNGAANVDAAFTTATAAVKFYDLAGNEVATRQAAVAPTVNGGGTACVISISVPTTLTPANYKVVVTLDNVKVGSDVVATSLSVFESVIGF